MSEYIETQNISLWKHFLHNVRRIFYVFDFFLNMSILSTVLKLYKIRIKQRESFFL